MRERECVNRKKECASGCVREKNEKVCEREIECVCVNDKECV